MRSGQLQATSLRLNVSSISLVSDGGNEKTGAHSSKRKKAFTSLLFLKLLIDKVMLALNATGPPNVAAV